MNITYFNISNAYFNELDFLFIKKYNFKVNYENRFV